ncbi:hypothetical protein CAOG_03863 [Capsaspora owczarzaki ATCC 30864]|uniref:hypothetical protein n=1 Tax=Capsaspora owczarzaki (strain ATCC 30864) TaxID=595528 RepID=UPI00035268E0|nr:hypothetical protein CAOG_03863 [Capsaspora owczarzaki ATCC 30864]|eukprot:XP_004363591.2 hypothetical protein CAOG_03863 [Capsaspora owczarzaki ATCC 30864]
MRESVYHEIVAMLEADFPPMEIVQRHSTIRAQKSQEWLKKTAYQHSSPEAMLLYWRAFTAMAFPADQVNASNPSPAPSAPSPTELTPENSIAWQLCMRYNIPPCTLARVLLSLFLAQGDVRDGISKKNPRVKELMQRPELIPDLVLRREVQCCIQYDDMTSPLVERVKHCVGAEYEALLQEKLRNLGIPFLNEEDMRKADAHKTPDIKLQAPIVVNGSVVLWIESKAYFGDRPNHTRNQAQLFGYLSRYGPGMVIYWFGFIDELNVDHDKGIQMLDHFPTKVSMELPPGMASDSL